MLAVALPACENASPVEHVAGKPALSNIPASGDLVENNSPADSNTVTTVIGPKGGSIRNGDHRLIVPPHAVTEDTEFTFALVGGDFVIVDLSAQHASDGAPVSTFSRPLTLRLSYRDTNVTDPHGLRIVHLVDGTVHGRREPQPSSVNPGRKNVSGWIHHFSKYAMEIN